MELAYYEDDVIREQKSHVSIKLSEGKPAGGGNDVTMIDLRNFRSELYSDDAEISWQAAIQLSQSKTPGAQVLSYALYDGQGHVATNAARALGIMDDLAKQAIYSLIWALIQNDSSLRSSAAFALGQIAKEPKLVVPALANALLDDEISVRQHAAEALDRFLDHIHMAESQLNLAKNDVDENVREFAIFALTTLKQNSN